MHILRVNCAGITIRLFIKRQPITKFSALNIDVDSLSIDLLGSRSPPYGGVKFGYPFKTHYCTLYTLIPEVAALSRCCRAVLCDVSLCGRPNRPHYGFCPYVRLSRAGS